MKTNLWTVALLVGLLGLSLWQLLSDESGIRRESARIGETPVWVYRPQSADSAPLVVVAHGFAGSRRLMEPLALALAGRGYIAVTYDFLGHGRHPQPMRGNLEAEDGTTAYLLQQTDEVVRGAARLPGGDGRVALAGHSMATDVLVRYAQDGASLVPAGTSETPAMSQDSTPQPRIEATVGISMFAPTVGATSPSNLLAIVGAWEGRLITEGRRVVSMTAGVEPDAVSPGTTYGDTDAGTARRLAIAPGVEHVGVLYSATTLEETVHWLDDSLGRSVESRSPSEVPTRARGRGLWIALLMAVVFLLARPLAGALPRVSPAPLGASASWRRLLLVGGLPALVTPLILRPLPTGFLPVVVGDYVAVHFLTVGLLTGLLLWWTGGRPGKERLTQVVLGSDPAGAVTRTVLGAALTLSFFLLLVAWPLDRFFTSFMPVAGRIPLLMAVLVGTLPYFLADEWLTRGAEARRGAYPATKAVFLLSLALAVALDFEGLFFLVLIIPLIVVFFTIHGLLSRWVYRATGSPMVAGLANAVAFAWALSVTFPLYAGP